MENERMPTGRAILWLIGMAIVLWIAFKIGAFLVQVALGLLVLVGLVYLLWKVFFAKKHPEEL